MLVCLYDLYVVNCGRHILRNHCLFLSSNQPKFEKASTASMLTMGPTSTIVTLPYTISCLNRMPSSVPVSKKGSGDSGADRVRAPPCVSEFHRERKS